MDTHTPGPFDIDQSAPDCIKIVSAETGHVVAIINGTDAEAMANARLICGSVYMLKALRSMLALMEARGLSSVSEAESVCQSARIAIMVASGRAE